MKKEAFLLLIFLALIPSITSQSIETPIQKITYHAEEYETGNINYAQLIVYTSTLSKDLAEEMGAVSQEHDVVLKAEQLESALGKPTETTKWVWLETGDGNGHEKKLDKEVPGWRKIIFDGKKTQLWLNAWPNLMIKDDEEILVYRLHLDTRFKSPEEQINIKGKIEEIKSIAEEYKVAPNEESLETLAKESVSAEQTFNNYFNQNPGKCEEVMSDLFGAENKRDNKKTLIEEIDFFEGDNFEAIIRLEMCDECEWSWINMDLHLESRGRFRQPEENRDFNPREKERYSVLTTESFQTQT